MPKSNRESVALTSAKNRLRGSREPWLALSAARSRIPVNDIQAFVRWLPKAQGRNSPVSISRFPSKLEELRRCPILGTVHINRELAWVTAQIIEVAQRVSHFLDLKSKFDRALCRGDATACFDALDTIEMDLGFSFWSIEARIGALQVHEGLEAQKAHLAKILKFLPGADVVSFFAFYVSRRFEPSIVPSRFSSTFVEMTSKWNNADGLGSYLDFRIAGVMPSSAIAYANILRYETSSSIVDQYETLVSLATTATIADDETLAEMFGQAILRLAQYVPDERLAKIMLIRGDESGLSRLTFISDLATDLVLKGEIAVAADYIARCIDERPNDPRLWYLSADIANAVGRPLLGGSCPADSAPRFLQALLGESHDGAREILPLLRLSTGFRHLSFGLTLLVYADEALLSYRMSGNKLSQAAFINRTGARADDVGLLPPSVRAAFFEAAMIALSTTPSVTRAAIIIGQPTYGLPDLCVEERLRAEVAALLLAEDTRAALAAVQPTIHAGDARLSRWAIRQAANAMLILGEHVVLARFIVTHAINRAGLIRSLPVVECVDGLDDKQRSSLLRDITLPIILHFAADADDKFADARSFAYEDFLITHNLQRPSQLKSKLADHDRALLCYYLRNICTQEIMQVSSEFQSTRELQEERIAVLRILVDIDPINVKTYENELREITLSVLVHSGVRHIGQTKIFVDVPALRRWAERNLADDFARYQALVQAGFGIDQDKVETLLLNYLNQGKITSSEKLELPKNEASDLLLKMVFALNNEFLNNPDHGLDCYLSMRIRHGTLAGQLRTPLEVENLITQRRAGSDEYTPNERWTNTLLSHQCDPQALDERLAQFSRSYDDLIAEMSNELIQIWSPERRTALFDGRVRAALFLSLAVDTTHEVEFGKFLDMCFEAYWGRVDVCLTGVRKFCNERLKPRISRMFNELETEIASLAGAARSDLETAIRSAATGANQALDIVSDWFRLPAPIEIQVFPIEAMIDVGLKCVTTIYPEFHPKLRKTIDPRIPHISDALTFFSDIFFIIFDNIRCHSGLTNPSVRLLVDQMGADAGESLPVLRFNIVSDVVHNAETVEARLSQIRERIETDDYKSAVISEGGTGLIKLHRILGRRNQDANLLDFGFKDGGFYVDFKVFWREAVI